MGTTALSNWVEGAEGAGEAGDEVATRRVADVEDRTQGGREVGDARHGQRVHEGDGLRDGVSVGGREQEGGRQTGRMALGLPHRHRDRSLWLAQRSPGTQREHHPAEGIVTARGQAPARADETSHQRADGPTLECRTCHLDTEVTELSALRQRLGHRRRRHRQTHPNPGRVPLSDSPHLEARTVDPARPDLDDISWTNGPPDVLRQEPESSRRRQQERIRRDDRQHPGHPRAALDPEIESRGERRQHRGCPRRPGHDTRSQGRQRDGKLHASS